MSRGVPEPDGPKYLRDSPPFTYNPSPSAEPPELSIDHDITENPETNKEFILKHKHILLTRGKYKGSTYQKAAQDADYISYCRQYAKHNELKNLILYHDKVKELAREIGYKAFFEKS